MITQWALWLDNANWLYLNEDQQLSDEQILMKFEETFGTQTEQLYRSSTNIEDFVEGCEQLKLLGLILQNNNQFDKAAKVYEKAVRCDPQFSTLSLEQLAHMQTKIGSIVSVQQREKLVQML